MIAGILSLAFCMSIGGLLAVHTYMLMNNMSTIEMSALYRQNPFHKGSKFENLAQTFGYDWKTWFLPIQPKDKPCNGINYSIKKNFN